MAGEKVKTLRCGPNLPPALKLDCTLPKLGIGRAKTPRVVSGRAQPSKPDVSGLWLQLSPQIGASCNCIRSSSQAALNGMITREAGASGLKPSRAPGGFGTPPPASLSSWDFLVVSHPGPFDAPDSARRLDRSPDSAGRARPERAPPPESPPAPCFTACNGRRRRRCSARPRRRRRCPAGLGRGRPWRARVLSGGARERSAGRPCRAEAAELPSERDVAGTGQQRAPPLAGPGSGPWEAGRTAFSPPLSLPIGDAIADTQSKAIRALSRGEKSKVRREL